MQDINKINKFTKTFYKSNDFVAKHVVSLMNYATDNKGKEVSRSPLYCYDVNDKRVHEIKKALSITTSDMIVLSNNNTESYSINGAASKESTKGLKGGGFVFVTPRDFDKLLDSLNTCVSWLCDDEYAKLFTIDANGNTVGVSDNNEVAISRFKTGWIMFKPAVIFDQKDTGYQGIYIKCDRGVLASLTGTEFKEFYNYMKELMTNFYSCSLALYNAGLMSMILHKE